jgi:hypothetical protein
MPQSWDVGHIILLPLRRKAYWGFFGCPKIQRLRPGLNPKLNVQMVLLMISTWFSKHVEDAKNWIKTIIWKVCVCFLRYITVHNIILQWCWIIPRKPFKGKGIPRQTEVALGVPGTLRPRIITNFDTTRVVGRQPNAPAAFTPGKIPGTHFQKLSRPQGTWYSRKEPRKKSTGNRSQGRPTSSAAP